MQIEPFSSIWKYTWKKRTNNTKAIIALFLMILPAIILGITIGIVY